MELTDTHVSLLRAALGLSQYNTSPTRNWIPDADMRGREQAVVDLLDAGHLEERPLHGEGGPTMMTYITGAGHQAYNMHVAFQEAQAAPEPAPEPVKPPRKPRAKAAAKEQAAGDLLAVGDNQAASGALALKTPEERAVLVLKSTETEEKLKALVLKSADITEVKDTDGREQVHRMAMDLKKARTGITHNGKAAREDAQAFSKAVIAEENRLIAITTEEETRLFKLRDDFDAEQARIEAERARIEAERIGAIRAKIDAINALPAQLAGSSAAEILVHLQKLATTEPTAEEYQELLGEAAVAIDTVGSAVSTLYHAAQRREAEEAERLRVQAEEKQRLADEAKRLADDRAEIERQRQEQEIAANALRVQAEQQANAMIAMQDLQGYGSAGGTAYDLEWLRSIAATFDVSEEKHGASAPMLTMAKNMTLQGMEQRIAALVVQELPAAWDEAIEHDRNMQALLDPAPDVKETPLSDGRTAMLEQHTIDWDEPAPLAQAAPEPEPAPEPAPAPAVVPEAEPAPAPAAQVGNYVRPNLQHLPMAAQQADANAESHFCANLRTLLAHRNPDNVAALFHQQLVMAIVEKRNNWPCVKP